jgi:hypothetical protein
VDFVTLSQLEPKVYHVTTHKLDNLDNGWQEGHLPGM